MRIPNIPGKIANLDFLGMSIAVFSCSEALHASLMRLHSNMVFLRLLKVFQLCRAGQPPSKCRSHSAAAKSTKCPARARSRLSFTLRLPTASKLSSPVTPGREKSAGRRWGGS